MEKTSQPTAEARLIASISSVDDADPVSSLPIL